MAKVFNFFQLILAVLFALCELDICQAKLPDYIMLCGANVTDMNKCVTDAVNFLRPKLKTGIPELKVPSLEPLHLNRIALTKGIKANITDLLVNGPSDFEVLEMKVNVPKNKFIFRVNMPCLHFTGKYAINTRMLLLQIVGEGPIHGNFTNYTFRASLKGQRVQGSDGEAYLQFNRLNLHITPGKTFLQLDNLFNGDKLLGDATNQIINESNEAIVDEFKPALEDALEVLFTEVANRVVSSYPHKDLFPAYKGIV